MSIKSLTNFPKSHHHKPYNALTALKSYALIDKPFSSILSSLLTDIFVKV